MRSTSSVSLWCSLLSGLLDLYGFTPPLGLSLTRQSIESLSVVFLLFLF